MELKRTRKAIALATVAAMLLAWLALEVATTGAGQAGAAGTSGSEFRRATRYYGVGPSAVYDFDSGSIGIVRPLRLSFASGTTFDVVITIAMNYRTSADDRFVVSPSVRRDGRYGPIVDVRPQARAVDASTKPTGSTTVFLITVYGGVTRTGSSRPSTSRVESETIHRSRAATLCSSWMRHACEVGPERIGGTLGPSDRETSVGHGGAERADRALGDRITDEDHLVGAGFGERLERAPEVRGIDGLDARLVRPFARTAGEPNEHARAPLEGRRVAPRELAGVVDRSALPREPLRVCSRTGRTTCSTCRRGGALRRARADPWSPPSALVARRASEAGWRRSSNATDPRT